MTGQDKQSIDFMIGQFTVSLAATTDALNKVTERLQVVTMTVETLNSKLNALSTLYQDKIEALEKKVTEVTQKQNRDYTRLNQLEIKFKELSDETEETVNKIVEDAVESHLKNCPNAKTTTGSEQRVFFIVLSVLTAISTIVALVK